MSLKAPPRIAIRGSGSIGMRHARVFSSLGAHVVLLPERAERVDELQASGFDAASPATVLDGVDGTVVCTRTGLHRATALQSLGPLLIEKPLAVDVHDGEALLAGATERGRSVHVAYCLRFNPGIRFLADQIGDIGSVDSIDVECHSWLPGWRPGRDYREVYSATAGEGGVLLDLSHELDLVNHLFGPGRCVLARVEAAKVLELETGVEETALLVTEHRGIPATIRLSFARRPESRRLRVFGRDGFLEWDAIACTARRLDMAGATVASVQWKDPGAMYVAQARAWLATLQGGDRGFLATGEEALQALRIVDAAKNMTKPTSGP